MASHRLWRVRKKYDHIDAEVERRAAGWELRIIRNGRRLLSWPRLRGRPALATTA